MVLQKVRTARAFPPVSPAVLLQRTVFRLRCVTLDRVYGYLDVGPSLVPPKTEAL